MRVPRPARTAVPAAGLATLLLLSGCGSDGSTATATTTTTTAAEDDLTATGSATGGSGTSGTADEPVAIDASASSEAYGDTWTATQVVRHIPVPESLPALEGSEIVAVEVTVTAGEEYYSTFGSSSFSLIGDDGTENAANSALDDALTAAGISPELQDADSGETSTGWLAFVLSDPDSSSLTLRYHQLGAQVVGSDTQIPDEDIDIDLL